MPSLSHVAVLVACFLGLSQGRLLKRRAVTEKGGLLAATPTAPGGGLLCVKWRKTLNCNPSGPRDPVQDKDCTVTIPGTEAGFCECVGYVYAAGADPYDRARMYGDKAVVSVNEAVGAARQGLQAAKDMIARMMSLKPWHEIAESGKQAQEAGARAQEMAKMARPFIYQQTSP